jgi:predicted dehydrogenase
MPSRIVIAGLGNHARHHYVPMLAQLVRQQRIRLVAVVDLENRREQIQKVLADAGINAVHFIGLSSLEAHSQDSALADLSAIKARHGCDGLIVSTDPRNHLPYLKWAAREDVDALVDKPLTASLMDFSPQSAEALTEAFETVNQLFARSRGTASVMVTRRRHAGYLMVREEIRRVVAEFGVPITFLNAYHANGYWNMPDEFRNRENHPYKYGFGAMLHGGYHVVDLAAWLLSVNEEETPARDWADRMEVLTQHATPDDFLEQVPRAAYEHFGLGQGLDEPFSPAGRGFARSCGETDVNVAFTARREGRVITMGNIQIMETAHSTRAWRNLPEDTYKGNGRHSQERLTLHVGHLMTVHTEDYRPLSASADPMMRAPANFTVRILRNSRLIGGEPYAEHVLTRPLSPEGDGREISLTEHSRRDAFMRWIAGDFSVSALATHEMSVRLMAAAHTCMFRRRRGEAPMTTFPITASTRTQATAPSSEEFDHV